MKITKESRRLMLAMSIGDGYIDNSGGICIAHSIKQYNYLIWKLNKLKSLGIRVSEPAFRSNSGYGRYDIRINSSSYGKLLKRMLYTPTKKVTRKILSQLDAAGLAIWYMDDGSISNKRDSKGNVESSVLTISTCVSREENQVIIDYLAEVWGVKFGQRKMKNNFALICGTKEARKFIKIVEGTVREIDSMTYKLNVKVDPKTISKESTPK